MQHLRAKDLKPGHVIRKAGTTVHAPITVTACNPHTLPGYGAIYGHTQGNPTPRLMFRQLAERLPMEVYPTTHCS